MRRLLVLRGPSLKAADIPDSLREHFEIEWVDGLDEALAAVREERVDAVLGETAELLALQRGLVGGQERDVLDAIHRAGRELACPDADILSRDAPERLGLLKERIVSFARSVLNYEHFSVLLINEDSGRLEAVVFEGLDGRGEKDELFAKTEHNGICGYVAATGAAYSCPDVARDPRYVPGLAGAGSSLTVPLRLGDKVVGVLNVESRRPSAFREDDRRFAEAFAEYVAIALHVLNVLALERRATRAEVGGSICAELAGPLDSIVTEASAIMEDYIGHDDLRRRLKKLIDSAAGMRGIIRQVRQAQRTGVLFVPLAPAGEDPVLAGKSVLVADDEELLRQTVCDVLTPCGCRVDLAADGAVAKDRIARKHYDLVISDIKMPGASGYEVFAAAKSADAETRVILITAFGYDPSHSIMRANQQGLSGVLFKPFKVRQLLDHCRKAFADGGE